MRSEIQQRDLEDMMRKRPVPNKLAYKRRAMQPVESKAGKEQARNICFGLPVVCKKVFFVVAFVVY